MEPKIKAIYQNLNKNVSNPQELINYTCKVARNLSEIWDYGDFCQKQIFQNTLFPFGLGYDAKKTIIEPLK